MQNRRKKEEKIEICTNCEQNLIKFIKCFKIRKKLFTNQKKGGILTFVLKKRHSFKVPGFDLGGEIIMKKNLVAVLAAVVMTASMVACGSAAATETTVETATVAEESTVAVESTVEETTVEATTEAATTEAATTEEATTEAATTEAATEEAATETATETVAE